MGTLKIITQKECLEIFDKTPFPRVGGEIRFIQRFMFRLNDFAKERGYRLFNWTEYMIQDEQLAGSWIISNIEELSGEIVEKEREFRK